MVGLALVIIRHRRVRRCARLRGAGSRVPVRAVPGKERSGLFVTHTGAITERTLRRARSICTEREGGLRSCLV